MQPIILNIFSILSMPNIFIILIALTRIATYSSLYNIIIIIFMFIGITKRKRRI